MKYFRATVIALALAVVSTGFGVASPSNGSTDQPQDAAMCSRCGDGYCAKQCGETAISCPKDCGGVPRLVVRAARW